MQIYKDLKLQIGELISELEHQDKVDLSGYVAKQAAQLALPPSSGGMAMATVSLHE